MVSSQAEKLNALLRSIPKQVNMDLVHQREAGEHQEDLTPEPQGVDYEDAPEVGGLWAKPQGSNSDAVILYLYGGGYVISSPHSRRKFAGRLAKASGTCSPLSPSTRTSISSRG